MSWIDGFIEVKLLESYKINMRKRIDDKTMFKDDTGAVQYLFRFLSCLSLKMKWVDFHENERNGQGKFSRHPVFYCMT